MLTARVPAVKRGERGFTLMELLVTMTIGTIVLFALFSLVDSALPASKRITARVDAEQRGRLALENMVRGIGSSVCVPNGSDASGAATFLSPVGAPSDDNEVTFYAQNPTPAQAAQNTFVPEKRQYQLSAGAIVERRWTGTPDPNVAGTWDFPATATSTRTLLSNVSAPAGIPMFSYQAYDSVSGALTTLPTGGVAAADLPRIVTVKMNIVARSSDSPAGSPQSATLSDAATIGLPINFTDTSTQAKGPECTA